MEGARRATVTFIMDEPYGNKPWDEADMRTWLNQNISKEGQEDIVEIESVYIESDMTDQDIT